MKFRLLLASHEGLEWIAFYLGGWVLVLFNHLRNLIQIKDPLVKWKNGRKHWPSAHPLQWHTACNTAKVNLNSLNQIQGLFPNSKMGSVIPFCKNNFRPKQGGRQASLKTPKSKTKITSLQQYYVLHKFTKKWHVLTLCFRMFYLLNDFTQYVLLSMLNACCKHNETWKPKI